MHSPLATVDHRVHLTPSEMSWKDSFGMNRHCFELEACHRIDYNVTPRFDDKALFVVQLHSDDDEEEEPGQQPPADRRDESPASHVRRHPLPKSIGSARTNDGEAVTHDSLNCGSRTKSSLPTGTPLARPPVLVSLKVLMSYRGEKRPREDVDDGRGAVVCEGKMYYPKGTIVQPASDHNGRGENAQFDIGSEGGHTHQLKRARAVGQTTTEEKALAPPPFSLPRRSASSV